MSFLNTDPNPKPRPDFRITATALEKRKSRPIAVTPDGAEIELTAEQSRDNVYERGTPLSEQLQCEISHVTTKTTWHPIATFAPRSTIGDGVRN